MKYIGFLLMFIGSSGLGMAFAEDYKQRILVLEKIRKMLTFICDRIRTEKDTLPEAFFHTGGRFDGKWKQFLRELYEESEKQTGVPLEEIWQEKSQILRQYMADEDFLQFKGAMKQTGFGTVEGQFEALTDYKQKVEKNLKELMEQKKEKCKLYQTLGVMCGILMIVILW